MTSNGTLTQQKHIMIYNIYEAKCHPKLMEHLFRIEAGTKQAYFEDSVTCLCLICLLCVYT